MGYFGVRNYFTKIYRKPDIRLRKSGFRCDRPFFNQDIGGAIYSEVNSYSRKIGANLVVQQELLWNINEMEIYLLIGCLGMFTGFISGLLGIGGGIIMTPLLLYVPPLLGLGSFSMRVVAGLTIIQGLLSCLSGGLTHRKFTFVSDKLSVYMGVSIFIAALAGGAAARYVSNKILLFIFACLAFIAALLMLAPVKNDIEYPDATGIDFFKTRAVTAATGVGILGGLVGQGGSFILIPLMTAYVKIPTRIAIGSNLAIVFLSSLAAFIGKAITGQIEWILAIPIVLTVIPFASVGGHVSRKVPVRWLRKLLAILIGLAAARMWASLLF